MHLNPCTRRRFLRYATALAAGTPWALTAADPTPQIAQPDERSGRPVSRVRSDANVAVTSCRGYGPEVRTALSRCFDLVGGIGSLVRGKTVTVKINLTGTNFAPFLDRPVGETFMTHYATAFALASLVFDAGARRVRFVESTQSKAGLETSLGYADWDLPALRALGQVEFENTRNLGSGKRYAHLKVASGGHLFSAFDLNHAYEETDVMVSLAKLKNHLTAGVTLTMKNLFGITPNSLYGGQAGSEDATDGRGPLHSPSGYEHLQLPGLREAHGSSDPTYRVPRIIVDVCSARPIDLAIIDGITAMSGGEGPWCGEAGALKLTTPGVLIVGRNPVSTDAVGTAIMGYTDPLAPRGVKPFALCDNHLLLAERAGLGTADLAQIDWRGLPLQQARHPYG